jgi:hypothetical protein
MLIVMKGMSFDEFLLIKPQVLGWHMGPGEAF